MSRIRIKNLGPIEYFENDVNEEMMVKAFRRSLRSF